MRSGKFNVRRIKIYGFLVSGILAITPQQIVMYGIGMLLIYLAIYKDFEPALLLPMVLVQF